MAGTAEELFICGATIKLGDTLKVNYKSGGSINGEVVELWDSKDCARQGRLASGWCFHDQDEIVSHDKKD